MIPAVNAHLKVATEESGSCRRYNDQGVCVEDDYVFGLDEQSHQAIENDKNLSPIVVKSGHVEIVGNGLGPPDKLIRIFQQQGILNTTPAERNEELAQLLTMLYLEEHSD